MEEATVALWWFVYVQSFVALAVSVAALLFARQALHKVRFLSSFRADEKSGRVEITTLGGGGGSGGRG